jgi:hypothetical protein
VVPVAAIASKPGGGVKAKHGPDFPGAKSGHELVEAGRATMPGEIIVDDLDIAKSSSPCFVDQIILPALALEIVLNLGLARLPNINDRFALQRFSTVAGRRSVLVIVAIPRRGAGGLQQNVGQMRDDLGPLGLGYLPSEWFRMLC